MALMHNFVLLNKDEFSYDDCCELIGKISYDVSIDDDLILYFMDYLKWLPTYSPLLKIRMHGFDYHTMTIMDVEGATEALILFSSLVNILKLAPNVLKLTGTYNFKLVDDDIIEPNQEVDRILRDTAGYEKIIMQKSEVIQKFEILIGLMQKVIDSNKNLYVLHVGV
ncbi:hypothetical protein D3C80_1276570 [compost metagenome]